MKKCISLLLFMVGFSFFLASCNYDYQNPVDQLKTHVVKGKVVKPVDGSVKEAIAGCQVKLIGSVLAVETDQTGQFTFYDFPPTHQRGKQEKQVAHTMQIWCEEGDWQKLVQDIHLEAENALDLGVIVLEKAADLKGKVSADSKSKDLTGIKVALAHTYYTTYTDKDGEYHFKKIAPGNYQLVAFHSQMGLGRLAIQHKPGTDTFGDITLNSQPADGEVSGNAVRIKGSTDHQGVEVKLLECMEVECSAITDPSGSFKMNSLTAGIYTLHLQKSSAGEGDGTAGATTYLPLILPNIPVGGDAVVSQEIPPLFLEPGIRSRDLGDAISDCDGDGKIDMAPGQADCQEFCHDQEDCQVICDQDNDNDGIPNQKEDNHCWCQPAGATYDPLVQSCRALVGDGVKRMPVARIEPQTRLEVEQGAKVDLDGSKSFSPNFGKSALQYHWTILKSPFSTTDKISSANVAKTTLTVSQVGIYQVQLQVSKNGVLSEPDRLIIDSKKPSNYPPKVKVQILDSSGQPLKDNRVPVNSKITLDGSGSSDPDPDDNMFLEYAWSIDKKPTGSTLAFERADIGKVEIKLDKKGEYGFTLTVKDLANHEVSESFTVEGY